MNHAQTYTRALVINSMTAMALTLIFTPAQAIDTSRTEVDAFVAEMNSEHELDADFVRTTLGDSKTQESIIKAISRPAERSKAWHEYRDIFITPKRIAAGVEFWKLQRPRLERIAEETGVPVTMLVGIIGVETYFGRITGSYRVIDALATLAFDYPPRGKFFRSELVELFLLARDEQLDLNTIKGSYAGAMGPPQFIPSSYRHYAVDGNNDGRRDLLSNWDDILSSVANYFVAHHWRSGEQVTARASISDKAKDLPTKNILKMTETIGSLGNLGVNFESDLKDSTSAQLVTLEGEDGTEHWVGFHNFFVITRYNRSVMYALAVWQLGEAIGDAVALEDAAVALEQSSEQEDAEKGPAS
jgi:membrane-bound lytic murein transglycosylase B